MVLYRWGIISEYDHRVAAKRGVEMRKKQAEPLPGNV